MRLTFSIIVIGKNSSASSAAVTQKSEKERKVDKPAENKVYWGTHACVALEPTDSENPFISQSNLKLLTNFNNAYNEQSDEETFNDDSSNINVINDSASFDNPKENYTQENCGEISKLINNCTSKKKSVKRTSSGSETVKKEATKRSYR